MRDGWAKALWACLYGRCCVPPPQEKRYGKCSPRPSSPPDLSARKALDTIARTELFRDIARRTNSLSARSSQLALEIVFLERSAAHIMKSRFACKRFDANLNACPSLDTAWSTMFGSARKSSDATSRAMAHWLIACTTMYGFARNSSEANLRLNPSNLRARNKK